MPRGKKLKDIDNKLTEIQHQARILALITTQRLLLEKIEHSKRRNRPHRKKKQNFANELRELVILCDAVL